MADALKQRGSLSIWFDPEMSWHAPPTGKRGRQPEFSDAAIQVCLTMKGERRKRKLPVAGFSLERVKPRAVQSAPPANHRVRRKPLSSGRAGLVNPGLQHPVPPSEDAERRHPVPWRIGTSPCVDAPVGARSFSVVWTVDRLRSCVRPRCAAFTQSPRAGMEIRSRSKSSLRTS